MASVFSEKRVKDLIGNRTEVWWVTPDTTVYEAALEMRHHRLRAIGVRDSSGGLVGVVSHSDLSNKIVAQDLEPTEELVQSVMSRDIVAVQEETSVVECLNIMLERNINHLAVQGSKFWGLISRKDVDRACLEQLDEYAKQLRSYMFLTGF